MDAITTARDYLNADADAVEDRWAGRTDADWQAAGLRHALTVFRRAAARVPAYRDFLRRHGVDPEAVRTADDFRAVPPMTKAGYLDRYGPADLTWDGDPTRAAVVHASSGTTGAAYYWPCSAEELARAALLYELILTRGLGVGAARTLLVVCFGMGSWVAGSYTTAAAQLVRQKGHPLTVVTPGFDKAESLALLVRLAPLFDQVVVAGIPSFVKDLLDAWRRAGAPARGRVKLFLAGEGFPEGWRDHVVGLTGGRPEDVVSVLGSADAGLIGFESPGSIAARRLAARDGRLRAALLPGERVPAVLNYVPTHRYFEAADGQLLLTADRTLPLVRYDTQDEGGILTAGEVSAAVRVTDPALAAWPPAGGWRCGTLPFVYVFGRGRMAATLYGANVPAEYVQEFLVLPAVAPHVSGRFTLETAYTPGHDQQLRVRLELAEGVVAGATPREWAALLADTLRGRSSEYARIWREYGERAVPDIRLYPYGDPDRFPTTAARKVS